MTLASDISALSNQSLMPGTKAAPRTSSSEDLSNNFMTLLVTQLKNQDPLNPMENAEMTSQLAQINTVGGIDSLNDTLRGINTQIEAGKSLQAAQLIGKEVLVPGDRVLAGEGGETTPFGVELGQGAERLKMTIYAADGTSVREEIVGPVPAGVDVMSWDGNLENGEQAPPGAYRVAVEAWNAEGEGLHVDTLNYAVVGSVSTDQAQGPLLDLGGISEPVRLDQIRQIL